MADTIRTRSAVLSLLADNVAGDISPQDIRDMVVSVFGVCAALSVSAGSTAQTGIDTSFGLFTGFDTDTSGAGLTPDHTSDKITVGTNGDGTYLALLQMSFSGSANETFTFALSVNGTETDFRCVRKLGTGGDVGSCSLVGLLSLSAADEVTVEVKAGTSAKQITAQEAQLILLRVL